jgi:hypothetical protein
MSGRPFANTFIITAASNTICTGSHDLSTLRFLQQTYPDHRCRYQRRSPDEEGQQGGWEAAARGGVAVGGGRVAIRQIE